MKNSNKGLSIGIYESKEIGNCSNKGISSYCDSVTIVSDDFNIPEIFEVCEERPAVVIVDRRGQNPYNDIIAVPRAYLETKKHYMFGGSFIYSSDSRFAEISNQPIKLFDRVER